MVVAWASLSEVNDREGLAESISEGIDTMSAREGRRDNEAKVCLRMCAFVVGVNERLGR